MSARQRTIDELAHETAAAMMPEVPPGQRVAAVLVSGFTGKGGNGAVRTAWRFVNCDDPAVQAKSLREIADLIETAARLPRG